MNWMILLQATGVVFGVVIGGGIMVYLLNRYPDVTLFFIALCLLVLTIWMVYVILGGNS